MRAEVRLRIPRPKVPVLDSNGYPIDHSSMRFRKVIDIPHYPHVGDSLELTTSAGRTLRATVTRAELDEPRGLFVLSSQYDGRSISVDDYAALSNDPEWELKHLLE